ncbi:hypothetical protein PIB30_115107, partial [Stylosanthes scabra]|nr:hypothetical protein [Stylosanthes scabra]
MRGTIDPISLQFDPEIERTVKRTRKERKAARQRQEQAMANPDPNQRRTLGDYATPSAEGCSTSITRPPIQANNFELKPSLLQLVQQDQFS